MHQLQQNIDRLRIVLLSERYEETPEIRDLAKELCDHSKQLNDRLRRCGEFLRQGLRAEAIHEAETEPRLLDSIAVMESFTDEERQAWTDVCEFLNLPVPEPMLRDVAIMLDEAYSEGAPLEKLMRQHRRLALQRAPLSQRLRTVRALMQQDPNTEHWQEDVTRYEEARLEQILEEAKVQKRNPSATVLTELLEELTSKAWTVAPSVKLVSAIQGLQQDARRNAARATLATLERELHEAYSAMNFRQAQEPYARWRQTLPDAGLPPDDPLLRRSLATLAWCEQEQQKAAAEEVWRMHLHAVEAALDDPAANLDRLQRIANQSERMDSPLPEPLATRFARRLRGLQVQRDRRRIAMAAAAASGTIAAAVAVVMFIMWSNEVSHRRQIIQRIQEIAKTGDVVRALALVDQFDSRWMDHPEWIDVKAQLDSDKKALAKREQDVMAVLAQAAAVPDTDEDANFERVIEQGTLLVDTEPVMDELKQKFERESGTLRIERSKKRKERDERRGMDIASAEASLKALQHDAPGMAEVEFEAQRKALQDQLNVLSGLPALDPNQLAAIKLHLSRLGDISRERAKWSLRNKLFADLRSKSHIARTGLAPDAIRDYASTLSRAAEACKSTDPQFAEDLLKVAKEEAVWKGLYEVQTALPTDAAHLLPPESAALGKLESRLTALLKDHPLCPLKPELDQYAAVVTARQRCQAGIADLQKFLGDDRMKGWYIVRETNNNAPYYLKDAKDVTGGTINRMQANGFDVPVKVTRGKLASPKPAPAPQTKLASELEKIVTGWTPEKWAHVFQRLAQATFKASDVDPILRLIVLQEVLETSAKGDADLKNRQAFRGFETELKEKLNDDIGKDIDWADPTSSNVAERRKKAEQFLNKASALDLTRIWEPTSPATPSTAGALYTRYEAVGYMYQDQDQKDRYQVYLAPIQRGSSEIFASVPEVEDANLTQQRHKFVVIGHRDSDQVKPTAELQKHYKPGRLVFQSLPAK